MPEANENEQAKATPKAADSVAAPTGSSLDSSDLEVDDKVDVSDSALMKARVGLSEATEEVADKKESEGSPEQAPASEDAAAEESEELDELSAAILKSLEIPEPEAPRTQTPEERIKELERKNEKLMKGMENNSKQPAEEKVEGPKPVDPEEYAKWVEETYGLDMDEFKKRMMFMNDYFRDIVQPKIDDIKSRLEKENLQKQLGSDTLYSKLQKDVDDIIKNDPLISSHPDEKARYQLALLKAKDKNMPAVIAAIKKQEAARAKANKRVVPTDRSSAGAPKAKGAPMDEASRQGMKLFGLTPEDMEKYKGTLTLDD